MPPFDLQLTDPAPDAVEKAMRQAVQTANGKARIGLMKEDLADYRRFLTEYTAMPEGVVLWWSDQGRVETYPPTPRGTLLGVVWRTTPLGRTVRIVGRRIEPFQEHPSHRFGPPWQRWPPLCLFDPDHIVLRTFTGQEPEAIAVCGCGAVGPPEKLCWMGGRCGPCHDHLGEHGRPLVDSEGSPALRTAGQLRRVGFLPSGESVAAIEWISHGRDASVNIAIWDRLTGKCRSELPRGAEPAPLEVEAGLLLGIHHLYWIGEEKPPATLGPDYYSANMAFQGTKAIALRYDGSVSYRDLATQTKWTECWPTRRNRDQIFRCLAFSPDGKKVALGRDDCLIDLLDWPDGTGPTIRPAGATSPVTEQRVHALAFSPDGKLLAAGVGQSGFVEDPAEDWWGWGGGLLLYDAVKGELIAEFPRERDDILTVAFSPDGSLLFTGATDCQIRVVDVTKREEIAVLGGHVGGVNDLTFAPDGNTLVSAGGDGLVRLWPWRQLLERPVRKSRSGARRG
jgi:hypothetical protein